MAISLDRRVPDLDWLWAENIEAPDLLAQYWESQRPQSYELASSCGTTLAYLPLQQHRQTAAHVSAQAAFTG